MLAASGGENRQNSKVLQLLEKNGTQSTGMNEVDWTLNFVCGSRQKPQKPRTAVKTQTCIGL
jgi:hypothetical protein